MLDRYFNPKTQTKKPNQKKLSKNVYNFLKKQNCTNIKTQKHPGHCKRNSKRQSVKKTNEPKPDRLPSKIMINKPGILQVDLGWLRPAMHYNSPE